MKKQLVFILTFLFLIICPVTAEASSVPSSIHLEIDAHNVSHPVSVTKQVDNFSVSPSLSSRIGVTSSLSTKATKKQIDLVYKALKNYNTTINVKGYGINPSNISTVFTKAFEKDYYLLDAIANAQIVPGRTYIDTRTNYFTKITLTYHYSKSTMKKRYTKTKAIVQTIKKNLGSGLSKEQAALSVHDYLIRRITYNMKYAQAVLNNPDYPVDWNSHTAYGVLIGKKGVCAGYAYAYRMILAAYNIPCLIMDSESMNHAWNMVKLGNSWYHVDVTWDDPDASSQWKKGSSGTLVYYTHFLLNNSEMTDTGHYGWTPNQKSSSKIYSSMPRHSSKEQIHEKGYWYLLQTDETLWYYTRYDLKGKNEKILRTSTSPLILYKDRIYYVKNQTQIRSMNINAGSSSDRDLTSLTGFAEGTSYKLKKFEGNTLHFYYLPANTTNSLTSSITLNSYHMRLTDKATSLKISASVKTLKKKAKYQLKAVVGPSWAVSKKVTYKTSNKKVASVTSSGIIKGLKKGTSVITVSVPGTSLKKTCKITVK